MRALLKWLDEGSRGLNLIVGLNADLFITWIVLWLLAGAALYLWY